MKAIIYLLLISAVVLCGAPLSFAGLLALDNFESYTAGSALVGSSGGMGWEGIWAANASAVTTVTEHTIAYPMTIDGVSYTGGTNAIKCSGPAGVVDNLIEREFLEQSDTVYFSVLVERHADGASADLFTQFQISSNSPANNNKLGGTALFLSKIDARLNYPNPTTGGPLAAGESYSYTDDTAFVVVKLSKSGTYGNNYDTVEMFVNPTSSIEPALADATVGTYDMGTSTVSYFALRSAYLSDTNYAYFDDVRIGTDFASVLPIAVPEPSVFAMLVALSIALPMMVWRRKK